MQQAAPTNFNLLAAQKEPYTERKKKADSLTETY